MKRSANLVSIEEMMEEQRKVFVLRYWYFLSVKEIMQECNMSKSKVESILYRVRNRLKDVLTERGYLQNSGICVEVKGEETD